MNLSDATPKQLNWLMAYIEQRSLKRYSPTTDPALTLPIIERMGIALWPDTEEGGYFASADGGRGQDHKGSTPLIAACRCYIASKLGTEVEVPQEIV